MLYFRYILPFLTLSGLAYSSLSFEKHGRYAISILFLSEFRHFNIPHKSLSNKIAIFALSISETSSSLKALFTRCGTSSYASSECEKASNSTHNNIVRPMNKIYIILSLSCALAITSSLSSCKNKQQDEDIMIEKIIDKPQSKATSMAAKSTSGTANWAGSKYNFSIRRAADTSLEDVENHDSIFHDNRIELTITRADGSQFFSQTFTKDSFSGLLNRDAKESGVFISMAYDKSDANHLYFVASIGSPDESYDDFTLVQLIIDRQGATTVASYTPPETAM